MKTNTARKIGTTTTTRTVTAEDAAARAKALNAKVKKLQEQAKRGVGPFVAPEVKVDAKVPPQGSLTRAVRRLTSPDRLSLYKELLGREAPKGSAVGMVAKAISAAIIKSGEVPAVVVTKLPKARQPRKPRGPSHTSITLELIQRPKGASVDEITAALMAFDSKLKGNVTYAKNRARDVLRRLAQGWYKNLRTVVEPGMWRHEDTFWLAAKRPSKDAEDVRDFTKELGRYVASKRG